VDPAQLLEQHLGDASPDLLRQMIATPRDPRRPCDRVRTRVDRDQLPRTT
jgi:hypothetical protein